MRRKVRPVQIPEEARVVLWLFNAKENYTFNVLTQQAQIVVYDKQSCLA
jgi:hypothetical protein